MPPVVAAVITAAVVIAAEASALVIGLALANVAFSIAAQFAFKPKAPKQGELQERHHITREAIQPHRVIYGLQRVSGQLVYATTFKSGGFENLWLVLAVAGHKCDSLVAAFLNDEEVNLELRSDVIGGTPYYVAVGKPYDGLVSFYFCNGDENQQAIPRLVQESAEHHSPQEWTVNHRLRGICYVGVRMIFNRNVFTAGIPNVSFVIRGKPVTDSRIGLSGWSNNPSAVIRDLLESFLNAKPQEFAISHWENVANLCDQQVPVLEGTGVFTANPSNDRITITDPKLRCKTGDVVTVKSSGTLPGGLSQNVDYYWISVDDINGVGRLATTLANAHSGTSINITSEGDGTHKILKRPSQSFTVSDSKDEIILTDTKVNFTTGDIVRVLSSGTLPGGLAAGTDYYWISLSGKRGRLATSLVNARSNTAVNITSNGSGTHRVVRISQLRYTINGTFTLDDSPTSVIEKMLTSCVGFMTYQQGLYYIWGGEYVTPSITIDENDLRDKLKFRTRPTRRELANAVRGTFSNPAKFYQLTDFPAVTNATYEAQDGGERFFADIELPWTDDPIRAQRIAKIILERSRQGITVDWPGKLTLLRIIPGDIIRVNVASAGWVNKPFRVVGWTLRPEGTIDLALQEEAAASYDWSQEDSTTIDHEPDTILPDVRSPLAPGAPVISEETYQTRESGGIKTKVTMSWAPPQNQVFIRDYLPEYRQSGNNTWTVLPSTTDTKVEIFDIDSGTFDFRVRCRNLRDAESDYSPITTAEIRGLLAPPSAPTNFHLQAVSNIAILRWDRSPDLDVRVGGQFRLRWTPKTTGQTWQSSIDIVSIDGKGLRIPGSDTSALVPLKAGSYLIKAVDSSGTESVNFAVVSTDGVTQLAFSPVNQVIESPTFPGVKTNLVVDGDRLKLVGETDFDSYGNIDDVAFWDLEGGIVQSGTYHFSAGIDCGEVKTVRVSVTVSVAVANEADTVDSRDAYIDDWPDIDGVVGAPCNVVVYERHTDDDPNGSPVWSNWAPIMIGDYRARAFEFKAELQSNNPDYNIYVETLSALVEEMA